MKEEVSPGSKENKPEGEPVKKRRRIIQLDSDDSGEDETFNPTKKVYGHLFYVQGGGMQSSTVIRRFLCLIFRKLCIVIVLKIKKIVYFLLSGSCGS